MRNKDRWSALSMSERADLINTYVKGGFLNLKDIKNHYNRFAEGGDTEGEGNAPVINANDYPTVEEYIQAKVDSTRNAAYEKSRSRNTGIKIPYTLSPLRRYMNENRVVDFREIADTSFVGPPKQTFNVGEVPSPYILSEYYSAVKELEDNCEYGLNCIGTATDNYPEDSRTVNNKDFYKNSGKYGFVRIPLEEVKEGDLVQASYIDEEGVDQPFHGMIFSGYDSNGQPLFNYSRGGITEWDYVLNGRYPVDDETLAYTYEGTPTLIQQWTEEYNNQKKFGGKINRFAFGGDTEGEVFVEELSPSVVTDYSALKQEARDARDWVLDYYRSEGYKNRATKAGLSTRYPLKRYLGIFPNKRISFLEDESVDESYTSYNKRLPVIGLQESDSPFTSNHTDEVGFTTAHELAHNSRLFNTFAKSYEDVYRSPYYGFNYKKLPKKYIGALEVRQLTDAHDSELSESYSDLIGLRYLLDKYNIFDSKDANTVFDSEMYNNLMQDERFKNDRFLKLHEEKQVIDAINNVAQNTIDSSRLDYVDSANIAKEGGFLTGIKNDLKSKLKSSQTNVKYGHISPVIAEYEEASDPYVKTFFNSDITGTTYFDDAINEVLLQQEAEDFSRAKEYNKRLNVKFSVPEDDPERLYTHKVNERVKELTTEEILSNLYSKSKEEVLDIQTQLAKEGFYDKYLTKGRSSSAAAIQAQLVHEKYLTTKDIDGNLGKNSITALQQMLVDKGYMPEFTEEGVTNIDGVLGSRTRNAYNQYNRDYNIDGKIGKSTKAAYILQQERLMQGFNMDVSAQGMVDQCAKWVAKKFDNVTGRGAQNGVYGNAWTMLKNIQNAGGKMIFNLYDDPAFNGVRNASTLKEATSKALENNTLDYSKLLEGDIVGIYIPSSSHHADVLKEGTTYNTHVGIVADIEDGVPIIEHNIGGKVRRERIDHLTGSTTGKPAVTVASRPKQGEFTRELPFESKTSEYALPEGSENALMREYMNSLASAKEAFAPIFTDVDMDFIEKAAIAITKRETNFMNTKQSDVLKGANGNTSKYLAAARKMAHTIKGTPEEIVSQDLTKMKFNSLKPVYRNSIGLNSPSQLSDDPTITGRAVMLLLSKNYDYFTRLAKQNPELGMTKEDIENATIMSYNKGLRGTATMGFNSDGSFNYDELMYLRYSSSPHAREKDISATNLKYLYNLGEYGELLADLLYSKRGAHQPYVSAAREVMQNLKKIEK